jgi:hypothetical protein
MSSIDLYPPKIQYKMIHSVCVLLTGVLAKRAAKLVEKKEHPVIQAAGCFFHSQARLVIRLSANCLTYQIVEVSVIDLKGGWLSRRYGHCLLSNLELRGLGASFKTCMPLIWGSGWKRGLEKGKKRSSEHDNP